MTSLKLFTCACAASHNARAHVNFHKKASTKKFFKASFFSSFFCRGARAGPPAAAAAVPCRPTPRRVAPPPEGGREAPPRAAGTRQIVFRKKNSRSEQKVSEKLFEAPERGRPPPRRRSRVAPQPAASPRPRSNDTCYGSTVTLYTDVTFASGGVHSQ